MSNFSKVNASEDKFSIDFIAECPSCDAELTPTSMIEWIGQKQTPFRCHKCGEKLLLGVVSVE